MQTYSELAISASRTITRAILGRYRSFALTTAGLVLTICDPNRDLSKFPPNQIVNTTSGYQVLYSEGNFVGDESSMVLPPYTSTELRCIKTASATYKWFCVGAQKRSVEVTAWTPTISWTTGDPGETLEAAEAIIVNGTCFFNFACSWSDGNGATAVTISLPAYAHDSDSYFAANAEQVVDGTKTNPIACIDAANATAANRKLLTFNALSTCTDAKAGSLAVSGFYEVDGSWTSYTSTVTITETPNMTTVARYKNMGGGVILFNIYTTTADSNAASTFTATLPEVPEDFDGYIACAGYELAGAGGATYYDCIPYIDSANATEATRNVVNLRNMTTATDAKTFSVVATGFYFIHDSKAWTIVPDFTGTDPTVTSVGRYAVDDFGLAHIVAYLTTADGNGCTAATLAGLPVSPKYLEGRDIQCAGLELVDTTYSKPLPYIQASSAIEATRKTIAFDGFSTMTDAKTGTLYVAGSYPVG